MDSLEVSQRNQTLVAETDFGAEEKKVETSGEKDYNLKVDLKDKLHCKQAATFAPAVAAATAVPAVPAAAICLLFSPFLPFCLQSYPQLLAPNRIGWIRKKEQFAGA